MEHTKPTAPRPPALRARPQRTDIRSPAVRLYAGISPWCGALVEHLPHNLVDGDIAHPEPAGLRAALRRALAQQIDTLGLRIGILIFLAV